MYRERRWCQPTEVKGAPIVTWSVKPGNNSRPAPNHYQVYKWAKNPDLPPVSLYDEPLTMEEQAHANPEITIHESVENTMAHADSSNEILNASESQEMQVEPS